MSAAAEALRAQVLGALKSHHLRASALAGAADWISATSILGLFSDRPSLDAIRANLRRAGDYIARLSPTGDLGKAASAGTYSHASWVGFAKVVWEDVAAQLRYLGDSMPTWNRVWDEVVSPTAAAVTTGIASAADNAMPALVLVVVGLVALVVLRVT